MEDSNLNIMPFKKGVATDAHVIVCAIEQPVYMSLTAQEFVVLEDLRSSPVTIDVFLSRHLSGYRDLSFKEAVNLLMKLQANHFISGISEDVTVSLKAFTKSSEGRFGSRFRQLLSLVQNILDVPLIQFKQSDIHPLLRSVGAILTSLPALILYVLIFLGLAYSSGTFVLPDQMAYFNLFHRPEILLLQAIFAFSLASSWIAFLQISALAGLGVKFLGGSIRITGLCVMRLQIEDNDVLSLPAKKIWRYHFFTLISPWLMGLLCWHLVQGTSFFSLGGLLAGTFVMLGFLMLCPLYRSSIVKVGEAFLAQLDVLNASKNYLSSGLISSANQKESMDRKQIWVTVFACISMVWLYAVFLLFFDVLIRAIPDLWVSATDLTNWVRALSAAIVLLLLVFAMAAPFVRLIMIPLQNMLATFSLPLRKVRVGINSYYSKNIPVSEAIVNFIREVPIFGHLDVSTLETIVSVLRYQNFRVGETIIQQGERGDKFFILADGRAQVIVESNGSRQVVDALAPGDSFGEIALIENSKRTASIRAMCPSKVLYLERSMFDHLFPEETVARIDLTKQIRYAKLILESQALSHLSPRQIRNLLDSCEVEEFHLGDILIKEGDIGDAAYIIINGLVQVESEGKKEKIAQLTKGDLVGATALVNKIPRTATVRAIEDGRWFKMDKESFLSMCKSNIFVGMLVSELTRSQMPPQDSVKGE